MDTGIVRVWGKCNNVDVVYTRNNQGLWEVSVPAPVNFTYVLEIWAEDGAGNVGYLATIRVTISRDNLNISKIEIIKMGSMFSIEAVEDIFGKINTSKINTSFESENINSSLGAPGALRTSFD